MKKYLITGCAGFIGSNFVHYMLKKYPEILLVNLDKLTYAGNLENLKDVEGDPRHVFVQGDICDKELVEGLFQKYDFDYVINFAAESHVDRSIKNPEIFVQSNVMGTVNLLQRAKEAWYDADAKTWKEGKKYLQVSTDEVYGALGADGFFMETTPLCPHSPYSSSKASADMFVMAFHDTYGMPVNITRCSNRSAISLFNCMAPGWDMKFLSRSFSTCVMNGVKISERFLPSLLYKVTNADSTSDSCTFSMAHNFLSRKCR